MRNRRRKRPLVVRRYHIQGCEREHEEKNDRLREIGLRALDSVAVYLQFRYLQAVGIV